MGKLNHDAEEIAPRIGLAENIVHVPILQIHTVESKPSAVFLPLRTPQLSGHPQGGANGKLSGGDQPSAEATCQPSISILYLSIHLQFDEHSGLDLIHEKD